MPHIELRKNTVTGLRERADVSHRTNRKTCHDNPIRFYGLEM